MKQLYDVYFNNESYFCLLSEDELRNKDEVMRHLSGLNTIGTI
jgi:hypothetical protein